MHTHTGFAHLSNHIIVDFNCDNCIERMSLLLDNQSQPNPLPMSALSPCEPLTENLQMLGIKVHKKDHDYKFTCPNSSRAEQPQSNKLSSPKVLFVDDENFILKMIKISLRNYSINSSYATSKKQALDILQNQAIDLIITDISMPENQGIEFIRSIAQSYPTIPVLLLTGGVTHDERQWLATLPTIKGTIPKPWGKYQLLSEMSRFIEIKTFDSEDKNNSNAAQ